MSVVLKRCESYDFNLVRENVLEMMNELSFLDKINSDTKVFIKLNCVGPFDCSLGITTHPIVLKAVLDIVKEKTDKIIVGDNPATREITYTLKKCGLYDVINEYNATIFDGKEFIKINNSNPKIYSTFEVSKQMIDTDILINIPKLKTHTLAYMTVAQKNFFGLIYGLNKSAWHVKASSPLEFGEAMNDLYGAFLESFTNKTLLHICDGILGLEGEGPSSSGLPKQANALLASYDAIAIDRVACELVKLDYEKLYINKIGNERGYGNGNINNIKIIGASLDDFKDISFIAPKDSLSHIGLKLLKFKPIRNLLLEHPTIKKDKCIKCGECAKICPPKAMKIESKQYPKLKNVSCIRCWCCAEVCPQNAIEKSKRPLLGRMLLKTDKE